MRARAQVNGREVGGASRRRRNREGLRAASKGEKFGLESMGCYSKAARRLESETGGGTPRSRVAIPLPGGGFLPESFVPFRTRFQPHEGARS
jgi:hypothetical protein